MLPIEIYTDGASKNNPGASGLGYVIRYWVDNESNNTSSDGMPEARKITFNQGYRLSTNNRMELMAAIYGLNKLLDLQKSDEAFESMKQINLSTDSEYLCKAINQRWIIKWVQNNWMTTGFNNTKPKSVKNKDLWQQIIDIMDKFKALNINLTFNYVKGHAGNELNEEADKLATSAASNIMSHIVDEEYEKIIGRR